MRLLPEDDIEIDDSEDDQEEWQPSLAEDPADEEKEYMSKLPRPSADAISSACGEISVIASWKVVLTSKL